MTRKPLPELIAAFADVEGLACRLRIYAPIGTDDGRISAAAVASMVDWAEQDSSVSRIDVRINSIGGSTTEGIGIYTALAQAKKPVYTYNDGVACSIASLILQAGGANGKGGGRLMARNGRAMIHSAAPTADTPMTAEVAVQVESINSQMAETYAGRTGKTVDNILALFDKGDTWFNAQEALDYGLVDELFDNGLPELTANAPAELVAEASSFLTPNPDMATVAELEARVADLNAASTTKDATIADLQAQLTQAQAQVTDLQAHLKSHTEASAKTLVEAAVAEGKIKQDAAAAWQKRAVEDLEGTRTLLDSIEAIAKPAPGAKPALPQPANPGIISAAAERMRLQKERGER